MLTLCILSLATVVAVTTDEEASVSKIIHLGPRYKHPQKGWIEVTVSRHTLSVLEQVYVGGEDLRRALARHDVDVHSWGDAVKLIKRYSDEGWIMGCVGYATAGFDYSPAQRVLTLLYEHLARTRR